MLKNKLLTFLILFFAIPQFAFADVFNSPKNLESIAPKLPPFNEVNCNFKQEKRLPNNVILKSSGKFSFKKETGVVFKTTYPIQAVNSYSPKEYNQINDIINAIANRKYAKIENQFNFYFVESSPWEFAMKPKASSQTSKYVKSIEIYGNKHISKLIITTTNAVKTTIWFYE